MQLKKMLLAIIIGVVLFITDMRFGWISVYTGGIWMIFLLLFIVGILAGDISGGFIAGLLTELIGVGLLALIPSILAPEAIITSTDLFARMWAIMALSLSYSARFPSAPVPWIEGLVIVILLIVLAPLVYAMALFFGLLGGVFGRIIHPRIFKPKDAPVHVPSQEPQPAHPAPEPPAPLDEDVPEVEEVEEDLGEAEELGSEPSE